MPPCLASHPACDAPRTGDICEIIQTDVLLSAGLVGSCCNMFLVVVLLLGVVIF